MSKHTPGPHKLNIHYNIIRDGVRHFPIHARKRGMIGSALREGDAILWAAAPDLLAALKSIWQWMENQAEGQRKGGHATFDLMMLCEQRDITRAAIDKAIGEA